MNHKIIFLFSIIGLCYFKVCAQNIPMPFMDAMFEKALNNYKEGINCYKGKEYKKAIQYFRESIKASNSTSNKGTCWLSETISEMPDTIVSVIYEDNNSFAVTNFVDPSMSNNLSIIEVRDNKMKKELTSVHYPTDNAIDWIAYCYLKMDSVNKARTISVNFCLEPIDHLADSIYIAETDFIMGEEKYIKFNSRNVRLSYNSLIKPYETSLEEFKQILGSEHWKFAFIYYSMGRVAHRAEKYEEAKKYVNKAYHIMIKYDKSHPLLKQLKELENDITISKQTKKEKTASDFGSNQIIIKNKRDSKKETEADSQQTTISQGKEIFKNGNKSTAKRKKRKLDLSNEHISVSGTFNPHMTNGQVYRFDSVCKGRYVCFEALNNCNDTELACIRQLIFRNTVTNIKNVTVIYSDSEEKPSNGKNYSANNMLTGSRDYWSSASGTDFPHYVVLDLGREYELTEFTYFESYDKEKESDDFNKGKIKDFRIYVSNKLFKGCSPAKLSTKDSILRLRDSLRFEAESILKRQYDYSENGDFSLLLSILNKSNNCLMKANEIQKDIDEDDKINYDRRIALNLFKMGEIYQEMGFYPQAKKTDSLAMLLMDADVRRIMDVNINYAYDLYYMGQIDSVGHFIDTRNDVLWYSTDKKHDLLKLKCAISRKEKGLLSLALRLRDGASYNRYIDHETLKTVAEVAIAEGNTKVVEETLELLMKNLRNNVRESFGKLGLSGRSRLWEIYKPYCDFIINMATKYQHNPEIIRIVYDATIFYKGLLLNSEIDLADIVNKEGDVEAKSLWKTVVEMRMNNHELNEDLAEYEFQLISKIPKYYKSTDKLVFGWTDVQAAMDNKDVCVEFVKANLDPMKHYIALILRKDWDAPKCVIIGSESNLRTKMMKGEDIYKTIDLGKFIWSNVVLCAGLERKNHVYFSPDGLLYQCGIEYLPLSQINNPINDMYTLFRVSNTKQLCYKRGDAGKAEIALFGGLIYNNINGGNKNESSVPYLPSTLKEVNNIKELATDMNWKTLLYTGLNGNKKSFMELSGKSIDIIHIATHAFYNRLITSHKETSNIDKPLSIESQIMLRSGLYFSNNNSEGTNHSQYCVVTSNEIEKMDLNSTDFVVLSACKTASGDILSDGVFGLQRGFKKAGVGALLISLWSVDDDATEILMEQFYKNLFMGKTKHQSLQSAQYYLKKQFDGKYESPKYWAPFILLDAYFM